MCFSTAQINILDQLAQSQVKAEMGPFSTQLTSTDSLLDSYIINILEMLPVLYACCTYVQRKEHLQRRERFSGSVTDD